MNTHMDSDEPTAAEPQTPEHQKILVIDDSKTIVDYVRGVIETRGKYAVVVAYDGEEGLKQVEREHPDCVVVDVMMPGMDGFQVVRCLRGDSRTREIPLIILTALGGVGPEMTGYLSGADEFIQKPFKPQQLSDAIERAMGLTARDRAERMKRLADGGAA